MQKWLEWKQREETEHEYMDNLYSECFHFRTVIFPHIFNYFHIFALSGPNHYIFKNSVICLNIFYILNAKTTYAMHHVCLVLRNLQNSPGYAVTPLAWSVSTCHLCHISRHSLKQFLLKFMQPYSTCLAHPFGRWYVIWWNRCAAFCTVARLLGPPRFPSSHAFRKAHICWDQHF